MVKFQGRGYLICISLGGGACKLGKASIPRVKFVDVTFCDAVNCGRVDKFEECNLGPF